MYNLKFIFSFFSSSIFLKSIFEVKYLKASVVEVKTCGVCFLTFDKVFESQDEARRMQIIEALQTIKEMFQRIVKL